jgi:HlyD family secretion protein
VRFPPSLPLPPERPGRSRGRRLLQRLLVLTVAAVGVAGVAYSGLLPSWGSSTNKDLPLSVSVGRGMLRIIVTERGNLESVKTVDGICELMGYQNKIIQILPEGSKVDKGAIVCKFDCSEIDKTITKQKIQAKQASTRVETTKQEVEITRNTGESAVIAATVDRDLAELDLDMYQKGTYIAESQKIDGTIALKKKELVEANNELEQMKGLVKKGFKSPANLRAAEGQLASKTLELESTTSEKHVKKDYEYRRKTTELTSRLDQARKKVDQQKAMAKASNARYDIEYVSAKATSMLEDEELKKWLDEKTKTVVRAEQSGIVAYANEESYDSSRQIRDGATVFGRQKIFTLPDLSNMQVKVNIHESLIKKIKPGQTAEIRVDAFPNVVIVGKIKTVSQLADSNRTWISGGVKEYSSVVSIEKMPKEELRPGMTSEVKIMVGELTDVLVVPVQAVAQHRTKFYAYVVTPLGLERREVVIGESNDLQVQVLEGLKEGESVALDARTRVAAAFKDEKEEDDRSKAGPPKAAPSPKG